MYPIASSQPLLDSCTACVSVLCYKRPSADTSIILQRLDKLAFELALPLVFIDNLIAGQHRDTEPVGYDLLSRNLVWQSKWKVPSLQRTPSLNHLIGRPLTCHS